jgi:hypothetical protein
LRTKEGLAGLSLAEDSLKKVWEGVIRTITADKFATAFKWWFERCQKCIRIDGRYIKKI